MEKEFDKLKDIEPLKIKKGASVSDFVKNCYGNSGFNARRFYEAYEIYNRMLKDDATICLTLAGAMTPIGMSGPIIELMKNGFVDFIISTGANLYHDLHRAFNCPMKQGDFRAEDNELKENDICRIYDVYIEDSATLYETDKAILRAIRKIELEEFSTADLHFLIGKEVLETAPYPEKSLLDKAYEYKVPIYTSSPGDSSIGMSLAMCYIFDGLKGLNINLDILETTAIVKSSEKNGVVIVGGGSPKNFYMQTQPMLWQMMNYDKGGHDYFIQLTADAPHWGGLSGATPSEAKSWGKIKDEKNSVVVYSCASITFPLLCQVVVDNNEPKKRKELYKKKKKLLEDLINSCRSDEVLRKKFSFI